MAKYLAIFTDVIEDIEVNGFVVMSEKEVNDYETLLESITWEFSYDLGEFKIDYTDGEDLLSKLEFKELNSDEVKSYKRLFNNKFGLFIPESFLLSQIDEDIDEDLDFDSDEDDLDY